MTDAGQGSGHAPVRVTCAQGYEGPRLPRPPPSWHRRRRRGNPPVLLSRQRRRPATVWALMRPYRSSALLHEPFFHNLTSASLPPSGAAAVPSGTVQAERRGSVTRPPARPSSCPVRLADGGPVTTMPGSGGATFRGAGPIWNGRRRVLRRTRPSSGHTPCPGSPEAPSGRPGVRVSVVLPRPGCRQDGALRRQPGGGEPQRRARQLTRQRHDPPPARTSVAGAQVAPEPRGERTLRLVAQPAPGHPHRMPAQHRAAGPAEPLAVPAAPARKGHRRQPREAGQLTPAAQLPAGEPAPSISASFGPIPRSRPGAAA